MGHLSLSFRDHAIPSRDTRGIEETCKERMRGTGANELFQQFPTQTPGPCKMYEHQVKYQTNDCLNPSTVVMFQLLPSSGRPACSLGKLNVNPWPSYCSKSPAFIFRREAPRGGRGWGLLRLTKRLFHPPPPHHHPPPTTTPSPPSVPGTPSGIILH